jgi:prolyl-tRNA synthetase
MRLTRAFIPTVKENPVDAKIVSHRLMIRAGLIRQHTSGIYNWLPIGAEVLRKVSQIVREEQNLAGAQEIIMPTIQSGHLWKESGRYDDYGPEMLRVYDRHNREMLYGPTHEEVVTDIFRNNIKSYKDLPLNLYQIHWKFRDEVRPRFGVMRGREFLMKDAYSFDLTYKQSQHSYNQMFVAYLKTFERLGLKAIPMLADPGPIGGNLSHEFIVLAETGESKVYCDKDLLSKKIDAYIDYSEDLQPIVDSWIKYYAVTEEKHNNNDPNLLNDNIISANGIEVGHIFHFGDKYSKPLNASVNGPNGERIFPYMGSYGIGVSRIIAAIIEANNDKDGIIWPESVAPYNLGLINLKVGNEETDKVSNSIYKKLTSIGCSVLLDDRDERAGFKFSDMDLIGIPWQIIIGPKGIKEGYVEFKNRKTKDNFRVKLDEISNKVKENVFLSLGK